MFSRNTQSTRKSWCSAEYSSQHLASKQGAWRLPLPFSVWSRDSRARQVCKIPQKAFKGPRTEGSKPHMQSSHHWIFACLQVSISFRLEAMQFCVTSASSSMGAELPQNSSWKFVDLSPKFILGTTIWVTSHPQPQTTAATKRWTVNYCGYLTIPLPPPTEMPPFTSHSAFSIFVRREVQCHCKGRRCNVTVNGTCYRAVRCELVKLIFILGSLSREFSRLIALHSHTAHGDRLTHLDCRSQQNLNLASLRLWQLSVQIW